MANRGNRNQYTDLDFMSCTKIIVNKIRIVALYNTSIGRYFFQIIVLVDLPNIERTVAIEINNSRRPGGKCIACRIYNAYLVVGSSFLACCA